MKEKRTFGLQHHGSGPSNQGSTDTETGTLSRGNGNAGSEEIQGSKGTRSDEGQEKSFLPSEEGQGFTISVGQDNGNKGDDGTFNKVFQDSF